tara:strand:+ start:151 stop:825 length:675 start_codon:yes stop_codon:yes gene_type:complete
MINLDKKLEKKSGIYFITEDALSPGNDDSKKVVKIGKAKCLKRRIENYKTNWNGVKTIGIIECPIHQLNTLEAEALHCEMFQPYKVPNSAELFYLYNQEHLIRKFIGEKMGEVIMASDKQMKKVQSEKAVILFNENGTVEGGTVPSLELRPNCYFIPGLKAGTLDDGETPRTVKIVKNGKEIFVPVSENFYRGSYKQITDGHDAKTKTKSGHKKTVQSESRLDV